MNIRSIKVTAVRVPIIGVGHFARARRTHAARTLLQMECDDGVVGLGETRGTEAARIIETRFAPQLTGQPVADLAALRACCLPAEPDYGYPEQLVDLNAFAAVDMAWWDLMGKRLSQPVYQLLGGAFRDSARFVAYEYTVDPNEGVPPSSVPARMADKAEQAIATTGAGFFEFKIGVYPVDCDIATAHAVRDRLGPGIAIGVDANMGLEFDTACRFLDAVSDISIANVEEPVADLGAMNELAARYGTPISSHCTSPQTLQAFPNVKGAVGDPHAQGGMLGIRDLAVRLSALNRRYWFRSVWELGVSWAAMCHMTMAFAPLERPMQALFNHIGDDLILEADYAMKGGAVAAPVRPGLGVTLDEAAVEKYRVTG